MKKIILLVLFLWQLPQNLLGMLLVAFYRPQRKIFLDNGVVLLFSDKMRGGISLGKYVIVNTGHYRTNKEESLKRETIRHELGHCRQSLILGWLYLLVVGAPSIVWAFLYGNVIQETPNGYYKFYTERWADRLAKITRT